MSSGGFGGRGGGRGGTLDYALHFDLDVTHLASVAQRDPGLALMLLRLDRA